jgi:hypothetical protein
MSCNNGDPKIIKPVVEFVKNAYNFRFPWSYINCFPPITSMSLDINLVLVWYNCFTLILLHFIQHRTLSPGFLSGFSTLPKTYLCPLLCCVFLISFIYNVFGHTASSVFSLPIMFHPVTACSHWVYCIFNPHKCMMEWPVFVVIRFHR